MERTAVPAQHPHSQLDTQELKMIMGMQYQIASHMVLHELSGAVVVENWRNCCNNEIIIL
jgi:hypothetical protein